MGGIKDEQASNRIEVVQIAEHGPPQQTRNRLAQALDAVILVHSKLRHVHLHVGGTQEVLSELFLGRSVRLREEPLLEVGGPVHEPLGTRRLAAAVPLIGDGENGMRTYTSTQENVAPRPCVTFSECSLTCRHLVVDQCGGDGEQCVFRIDELEMVWERARHRRLHVRHRNWQPHITAFRVRL